ncbi:helix-turn-helix transcriptional regulator [Vibrio lentus]|uniref:Transcriptional regulator n=1 Tax=Vibrio lentus TaxID=136468 RepID=A0AB36XIM0_9VIBR|nr:helix-turn-helix transcriptional regulator [Vibrio lentus]MCC4840289.1 helix-turn-helix domain-containing protein [Vibrio lentus]PMI16141.1 transcriptional regulator [Vibrio lentus]PMK31150.1 transcriptional regulator [Vibrio lentus]PMK45048.1 transcriptional regulator [Vibrio lentus]PML29958.1 transcriptional regulator [Vibrio lentus]
MTVTFSQYLQDFRKRTNLTQQEVLEHLISSDSSFSKLDLTTFSRWERGITTPKLSKQLLAARVLGSDIATLIDPETDAPDKKKHLFDLVKNRTLSPYQANTQNFVTRHYSSLINEPEICRNLITFHSDYLAMNMKADILQKSNLQLQAFLDSSGSLIGHLLYGFNTSDTPTKLLDPENLSECPFIETIELLNTPLNLYIVSSYSSLSAPRMALILMILDALRQHPEVKYLYVNCHDQEGYSLYEANADCEIIAKGRHLPFGGVKVYGKHYRYIQLKINAESILASKVVSDLVPFTKEYIHGLIGNDN